MNQVQSLGTLLGIVRRRLAILILAVSVGVLGSVVFALTKPPRYETSAKILVVSPQISDELARSTVDLTAAARLRVIEQRMLARDSLSAIIEKHGLFADAPGLNMAEKVELIRASTVIESISASQGGVSNNDGLVAFTITVSLGNAEQAAAVVNELVASAIEQNLKARAARARDTLIYFEQEARAASLALAEKEVEITAFKKAHESALPEGLEASRSALSRVESADMEVDGRILELETRWAELEAALAGDASALAGANALSPGESELRRLELELAQKRRVLGRAHPELKRLEQQLAAVETLVVPTEEGAEASDAGVTGRRRAVIERQMGQIAAQTEQLRAHKQALAEERRQLKQAIRRTPEVEVALNALNRELVELQERYSDVARRREEARIGEQLEANQQSERFEVLEEALLPDHPVGPNRKKIVVFGSGASVGLALGLIFLLEMMNPALRTTAQMERRLGLIPVVSIPYVSAPGERWRRRGVRTAGLLLGAAAVWLAAALIDRYITPLDPLADAVMAQLGVQPEDRGD